MDGFLAMKGGGQELPGGVHRRHQGGETCACCTLTHVHTHTHVQMNSHTDTNLHAHAYKYVCKRFTRTRIDHKPVNTSANTIKLN